LNRPPNFHLTSSNSHRLGSILLALDARPSIDSTLRPQSRAALRVTLSRDLLSAGRPRPGIRSCICGIGLPSVWL